MSYKILHRAVLSVSVGSRPTAPATLPCSPKTKTKISDKLKLTGIAALKSDGWILENLLRAATTTKHPINRQTREVALSAYLSSHKVIAINTKFTARIRLTPLSFRSAH